MRGTSRNVEVDRHVRLSKEEDKEVITTDYDYGLKVYPDIQSEVPVSDCV